MPTSKEKRLDTVKAIGILAGGGDIPLHVITACQAQGIEPFVVAFEGQTDEATLKDVDHVWMPLTAVSKILKALKARGISDLVLIGKVRRPSFKDLKFDLKAAEFIATEGRKAQGDDALLKALRRFLEKEGFAVHGVQGLLPDLLMTGGVLGDVSPSQDNMDDIRRGVAVLQALGAQDVGQAVVVQQGHVLGIEAAEGTDALIRRCGALKRNGSAPVLVKLCKPGQDQDLDLPTIGPETLENVVEAGFAGIAAHTGKSFFYERETVLAQANARRIFVMGIDPEDTEFKA